MAEKIREQSAKGLREKDANLGTALLLKAELEKYGAIVKMTRSTDIFLELSERTFIANSSDFDAFISVHSDSLNTTATGSTSYYNTSVNFNGQEAKQWQIRFRINLSTHWAPMTEA
ncbi:N-acetylmuramoyl-L-alanine amidase [Neobacillus sp. PS3-34]|uniref:N-acetylmuramoyl-L-alanine amidase family protein n=1 Tax=Neobacillus sp. PS3-34 TaxID=3070678 RepID=UPI0027DEE2ED|nr:N-acetylmuramoyl-L-alanine amidase [Neobacillus sp. PS3-34]WML46872.1 N-acetylmuramoyl-L-alanine amidase [Neobacillus sp. PS3-34]